MVLHSEQPRHGVELSQIQDNMSGCSDLHAATESIESLQYLGLAALGTPGQS